jgi:hypothetical protein
VIYKRLGTKALLLKDGKFVREMNRSFYHANVYAYPVCLLRGPDNRILVAHCPDEYNRIELDDASRGAPDDFDSPKARGLFPFPPTGEPGREMAPECGLGLAPIRCHLLVQGRHCFSRSNLVRPIRSSAAHRRQVGLVEESSACWQTAKHLLIGGGEDEEDPEEAAQFSGAHVPAKGLAVYDIVEGEFVASCSFGHAASAPTVSETDPQL